MSKRLSKKERRVKRMAGDSEKTKETLQRLDLEMKEKKKQLNKQVSSATKRARIKKKKRSKSFRKKDVSNYFRLIYKYDAVKIKEDLEKQKIGYNRLELVKSYDKFLRSILRNSRVILSKEDIEKDYKLFYDLYVLFQFNENKERDIKQKQKTFYTNIIYTPTGNKR